MSILVTGGMGYIGSHTCIKLIENGNEIIILDNLSNSKETVLDRIFEITGVRPSFYKIDITDKSLVEEVFKKESIEGIIHFAGLKAVGESVQLPIEYYQTNIMGTLNLLECMKKYNVKNFIFSSSATVYGDKYPVPFIEEYEINSSLATNPYGRSKIINEEMLKDLYKADNSFNIALLRYFNPIGAHKSGKIGEDPKGIPNNLLPYITQVAIGKLEKLNIYGDDYDTPDGTGVRDYIHVEDLARGHILAYEWIKNGKGLEIFNLGAGKGTSVLEILKAFESACGKKLNYEITSRRPGDIGTCYADVNKAYDILGFKVENSIEDMCIDSWRWQSQNPDGF